MQFHSGFGAADYAAAARASNGAGARPLSLYVHVPFFESPCFYCGCNKVVTRDHAKATAYLGRLSREIAQQAALFDRGRPVDQLHFGGGTPTFLSDAELAAVLADLGRQFALRRDSGGEYSIEIDPRTVSEARLEVLRDLGFNRISLGVQDFEPEVQQAVNRVQSQADTLSLIRRARQLHIDSVSLDLIYGLPRQTPASFARTLALVVNARPDRIAAYSYAHLPQVFKAQRQIKIEQLLSPAEKLGLLGLTVETLCATGYVYIGMDHFALPDDELVRAQRAGTLQRNFQGYSTRADCDLVALGVSAISKVGDSYAQNARTLNEYYRCIDAGDLAVQRGVLLGPDDRIRRDLIQRLMCATGCEFAALDSAHGIRFEDYFAAELKALAPLEQDGLVLRSGRALRLAARGRLLMRNVAMIFDAHLPRSQQPGAVPRYSRAV